jgi:hypothetical protein
MSLPVLTADLTFDAAGELVLVYLREHVPLAFWSMTRVENGRQTFLYADSDNEYGLPIGASQPWEDSFCISHGGGCSSPGRTRSQAIPVYAGSAANAALKSAPTLAPSSTSPTGLLFGAICGVDPKVRTDDARLVAATPLLQLLGQLLTMVLAADRAREATTAEFVVGHTRRGDRRHDRSLQQAC